MEQKNILVFMSDQHAPKMSSYIGGLARTPPLKNMGERGMIFAAAYTACPLCVPARMAFLSGRLPSRTGILNNFTVLPDTTPTIAHAFSAAGYETVLVGRMHFVGEDQRHGFHHRLVGDITSPEWKPSRPLLEKLRGPFIKCFDELGSTQIIGGGGSPVQDYDQQVLFAALDWLSRPHEKPQFVVVGTYGPHFPYVAPEELYRYYRERVSLPAGFLNPPDYLDPTAKIRLARSSRDPETALRAQAAYCGMIEQVDGYIGAVRSAFWDYCKRTGESGVFLYTSDHGDQCGERGLFGKMSFFESSARIPLLIEGDGIPQGVRRTEPVSLLDLLPTLCGLAHASPPPCQDGEDILSGEIPNDRAVISEMYGIFGAPGKFPEVASMNSLSRMVRKGRYKYITRRGFEDWDLLFDLEEDPGESRNILPEEPEIAAALKKELTALPGPDEVKETQLVNAQIYDFMQLAQRPSEKLLAEFWTGTKPENLELPVVQ